MDHLLSPLRIFPRLKIDRSHALYEGDHGRHMEEPLWAPNLPESIIHTPMVADIGLTFIEYSEAGFRFLRERDREGQTGRDDAWFTHHAFRNLMEGIGRSATLELRENGVYQVRAGGLHEASLILLGNFWVELVDEYGENLYAAIPAHNELFVAPAHSYFSILHLQKVIRNVFNDLEYLQPLSKSIYQRINGEWHIVATAF